ncbi:MAG TPA: patatin-like phospholipase family protein [Bacteroidota bacterium]|nr:patatin-like phospholipase family protein [Bacteroidota bacterium]
MRLLVKLLFILTISLSITFSQNNRSRIALILSGGGAKGFAHIGTLQILDSLGIKPDFIVGTSMGGIIGGLYSIGYSGKEIEKLAYNTNWTELFTDTPPRNLLPHFIKKNTGKYQLEFGLKNFTPVIPSGIVQGQKISQLFTKLCLNFESVENFDSLPIPFRCVTVDAVSGKEIVISKGQLSKALRATMAIPTIFSPVEWDSLLLLDGGILNNFPVDIAINLGYDFIIGCNVSAPKKNKDQLKNLISLLDQTINIPGYEKEEKNCLNTDILIVPEISNFSAQDFNDEDVKNIIQLGKDAVKKDILKFIELKNRLDSSEIRSEEKIEKRKSLNKKIIHGIVIFGNESLPFTFIYNLFGLNPGDVFDPSLFDQRITEVYGLGYFESINYEIESIKENYIRLLIKVKEKPLRKLLLGVRYDDFYKLVGIIGLQANNLPFPGLRFESELQFAGLTRFLTKLSYPTRSLDLPVYPFLKFNYKNVPINVYDEEARKIASYSDNSFSFSLGLGFSLNKFWVLEASYDNEFMNIKPNIAPIYFFNFPTWKDRLRKITLSLDFDLLDDLIYPEDGILVQANLERSYKELGSDVSYWKIDAAIDFYSTINKKHTFQFYSFYGNSSPQLPTYKGFVKGGPETFIGLDYNQILANKLGILKVSYKYKYKKDIFLKAIANFGFDYNNSGIELPKGHKVMWGYGLGVEFVSPLGPFQLIISNGEKSFLKPGNQRILTYITAGFKF